MGALVAGGNRLDDHEAGGGHFTPEEIGTLRTGSHDLGLDTPERFPLVANTLAADGHDASEDGTGRQTYVASSDPDGARAASRLPGRLDDPLRAVTCPVEPRPDGPRERQMGNAVTVNVAEWIGRRIVSYESTAIEIQEVAS